MMASSPRAVFTRQRNITTRVYVAISSIILLYLSISVEASIHSVQERFTSRVGGTVNIPFEYCDKPSSSCTHHRFNLSAPNPTCTVDRYGHCEVARAPDNDPFREDMGMGCELCVLVIHGVTQKDAGRYSMCQTSGACTSSFWRYISTLEVEEPLTPTNSTFTTVSTKPTTDLKKTTKPEDAPTNVSEINTLTGTDAQPGNTARSSTSSAVGIPITIVILVIVVVVFGVYLYKWRGRRQHTLQTHESPNANTTVIVDIDEEIVNEGTGLRAEPESDT